MISLILDRFLSITRSCSIQKTMSQNGSRERYVHTSVAALNDKKIILSPPSLPPSPSSSQLLGELLLDRHNFTTMTRYISNPENLKLMMMMLRDPSRNIQFEAFHVFKVYTSELVHENLSLGTKPKG